MRLINPILSCFFINFALDVIFVAQCLLPILVITPRLGIKIELVWADILYLGIKIELVWINSLYLGIKIGLVWIDHLCFDVKN